MNDYENENTEKETDSEENEELLTQIRENYETAKTYWGEFYTQMESDIDFALGEGHWEDLPEDCPNKVKLVINKCPSFVNNIINEMRASRPSIHVLPDDDDADEETGEVRAGIIRKAEKASKADTAYDVAAAFQVTAGLGWITVRTDWVRGTFKQKIIIDTVHDFSRILIDPSSVELDGRDARYGFIQSAMSKEQFKEQYPDAQVIDFDGGGKAWVKDKQVVVCEYYYIECEIEKLHEVSMNGQLDVLRESDRKELEQKLGYKVEKLKDGDPFSGRVYITRSRDEKVDLVKWCKTNGQEILEKTDWLGERIPIVPVYGNTIWNNGKRHISGLISVMRDPQIMLNYWESSHTEVVALQPKSPWVVAEGQIDEYQEMWKDANTKNYPVLSYKPTVTIKNGQAFPDPPPMRQPPAQPSMAMVQSALNASEYMKSVTGIYDASQGKETNQDRSGKAILALQRQGDTASYHYIDNQSKSVCAVGDIVNDLISKLFVDKQNVRVVGEDRKEERISINQPTEIKRDGKKTMGVYDMEKGTYTTHVTVGPSYASKRQESLEAQLQLAELMPEVMSVAADLIASNIDAPGMKEIAKRLKKALPPGVADDEQTPEQMALMKAQQAVDLFKNQLVELQKQLDSKERAENMDFEIKKEQNTIKEQEVKIKAFQAELEFYKAQAEIGTMPANVLPNILSTIQELQAGNNDARTALELLLSEDEGIPSQAPQNAMNIPEQGIQNV